MKNFGKRLASVFVEFDDSKAKETSPEEIDKILQDLDSDKSATNVVIPEVITKGRIFSEIYAEQSVMSSPKTAEEVLKIIDGMSALPIEVRKISIEAMDLADDSWTIEDVKLDASNKIAALQDYKTALG